MAKTSQAQLRASAKYIKSTQRQYLLKVNKKTETELYEWMESIENRQGYLKELVLADMKAKSGRANP